MKIGTIVTPNSKGQIVIPQKIRQQLGIDENTSLNLILQDNALHIYPITEAHHTSKTENTYLKVLQKTKGTWEITTEETREEDERKEQELKKTEESKKTW